MSSLTFGPKWVRDLSSGDNNAAAPPNTPPPRKYKLAEFRYGREEMLALLSDNYDFPLGLKEFEDIINKRPVQPLAFVPVSEEEERCHMGGVNSALVLKLTGRGAPVLRGRGAVRGRGRGRAADYPLHRSSSTSEDSSYSQKPWPEIQQRGGYHRPVGRGESFDGLPARVGYEPTRSRISGDGTQPSPRSGEYWRSNSTEAPASVEDPGSPSQENGSDGWRQSGTKLPVTKPIVNKKGFADNARNWRDVKEQQQQTNSEQSPHTNSKTWTRSSSQEKEGNSNLPEWCNDDSLDDAVQGSFDSSGQYRSFKEQEKEVLDNDTSETSVIQEKISLKNGDSKSSSPIIVSNTESPKNVPILNVSVDTLPTNKSSDHSEVNPSSLNVDIAIKNISNEVGTTKDVSNKEVKKDDKTKDSIIHKEDKVSMKTDEPIPNFHQINLPSSKEDPVIQDADFEFSLDHIKDMVENLDYESEEEDKSYQDNFKTHSTVNDPSIVYAKKAEPGKAINGLQDWIYRDPQGEVQGPFSNDEMLEWFKAGYFTMGLLVRRICDEAFLPLEYVIKLWGRIPFTLKNQPPPITNQMLQAYRQHEQAQLLRLQHLQQQQQKQKIAQRQQQQQLQQRQQQQQQQQMTQTLLKHLHIESRPQDSGIQDLSVWGDISTNHSPNTGSTPWAPGLDNDTNVWNVKPSEALMLRDVEAEQSKQAMLERQSTTQIEQFNGDLQQANNNGNKDHENENEKTVQEKNETKKSNKSNKKKYKEKAEEQEIRRQVEAEQRQKERDEAQRKAMEALKHQQQLQQQQKNAEQKRLIEEQSRRDEIIRTKQQQQQQQMHQQMLLQKYQQEHQQKHQVSSNPIWQMTPTSSAPSLAEIQRAQERKEAEVHEHMKTIHQHDQIVQQQRAQARWAQQQGFQSQLKQNHHQVKPLVEIQAEEAQKVLQQQQQRQHLQQQQQVNHGFNQLPWNSSGQPLVSKSNKSNNAIFWDDVIGIPSASRPNGNSSIQQQVQYQGVQQQRKGYNDFPPFQSGSKTSKKENKDQEIVNRIFQAPTPSSDFINWVERNLPAVKKAIDVPTVVSFLQDIESPYEVHDYMRSYLGDSNEQKEFVKEFLERRKKAGQQQKQRSVSTTSSNDDFYQRFLYN